MSVDARSEVKKGAAPFHDVVHRILQRREVGSISGERFEQGVAQGMIWLLRDAEIDDEDLPDVCMTCLELVEFLRAEQSRAFGLHAGKMAELVHSANELLGAIKARMRERGILLENLLEELQRRLAITLRGVHAMISPPKQGCGYWFLEVRRGVLRLTIQWTPQKDGFLIVGNDEDGHAEDVEEACGKIAEMLGSS
jgi:hypothetical protein